MICWVTMGQTPRMTSEDAMSAIGYLGVSAVSFEIWAGDHGIQTTEEFQNLKEAIDEASSAMEWMLKRSHLIQRYIAIHGDDNIDASSEIEFIDPMELDRLPGNDRFNL